MTSVKGKEVKEYNELKVDINKFKIHALRWKTAISSTYLIQDKNTGEEYNCMVIEAYLEDNNNQRIINDKIHQIIRFQHPTLIKIEGYSEFDFEGRNCATVIFDRRICCTVDIFLQQLFRKQHERNSFNTVKQKILVGVSRGMKYLHDHHIIHCQLNPFNILLDEEQNPIISNIITKEIKEIEGKNDKQYRNIIKNYQSQMKEDHNNGKADVYSFGILMYEMIGEMSILKEKENMNKNMNTSEYKPNVCNISNEISPSIKQLIERCISREPSKRPTFDEIFNKLAFNIDDPVFDIYTGNKKSSIEYEYFLPNSNINEIFSYVDSIIDDNVCKDSMQKCEF